MNLAMAKSPDLSVVLHQIVDLNFEFRELIAAGDWEAATRIEQARRDAMQGLFERPMEPVTRQQVINTLSEILQSDQLLVHDLEHARDLCSSQISHMQLGRKATTAYNDNGLMVQSPRLMQ